MAYVVCSDYEWAFSLSDVHRYMGIGLIISVAMGMEVRMRIAAIKKRDVSKYLIHPSIWCLVRFLPRGEEGFEHFFLGL